MMRFDASTKLMECAGNLQASRVWKIRNPQKTLPLEQLAPFFLNVFLLRNQTTTVRQSAPVVSVWESDRYLNVVTMKDLTPHLGAFDKKFISFHDFIKPVHPSLPFDDKDILNAFCMLNLAPNVIKSHLVLV